jgi:malonyl-CoA O-methyltransferase
VTALSAREGYALWAPRYEIETAISFLEDRLVTALQVPLLNRRLLDAGCGTGRRMCDSGAALAVGVDLTPDMLTRSVAGASLAAADVRALPFPSDSFDVVWCRLVIGHIRELDAAYAELARVCRPGGTLVVTDFHPDAVAAGHRRSFRDLSGQVREIEHYKHDMRAHERIARALGLTLWSRRDAEVGPLVRPFYERARRLAAYERQRGLRIVLALTFRRGIEQ